MAYTGEATPPANGGLNPAQACKKLRTEMGAAAFRLAYGTNNLPLGPIFPPRRTVPLLLRQPRQNGGSGRWLRRIPPLGVSSLGHRVKV